MYVLIFSYIPMENIIFVHITHNPVYIASNKQVATSLLTSCNRQVCYQEAENTLVINMLARDLLSIYVRMRSQGLRHLFNNKSRGAPDSDLFYTRKNLTTCSKSANKPSTSCVRTACYKLSTSLEQAVINL